MENPDRSEQKSEHNLSQTELKLFQDTYMGVAQLSSSDEATRNAQRELQKSQVLPQIEIDETKGTASEKAALRSIQLFQRLDSDGNDFLGKRELSTALQDNNIKGQDALALAALYRYYDWLVELHDDFGSEKSRGISKADLTQFKATASVGVEDFAKAKEALAFFKPSAPGNKTPDFAKFDLDGDAALSDEELRKASSAGRSVGDAAMLQYLMKERLENGALHRAETPSVNEAAVEKLVREKVAAFSINSEIGELSRRLDKSLAALKPEATESYSYPDQGQIGDCYLVAAVASIMRYEPALLKAMIRQNENDTITVTFPGDKEHPVNILPPTEAEQTVFLSGSPTGSIIEKALGEYRRQKERSIDAMAAAETFGEAAELELAPKTSPIEALDGGWDMFATLRLLTGRDYGAAQLTARPQSDKPWQISQEQFAHYLSEHLAKGNGGALNLTMLRRTPASESYEHAYSLLDFDAAGKDGGTVTIRDPHGGFEDGIKKYSVMELSELKAYVFGPLDTTGGR